MGKKNKYKQQSDDPNDKKDQQSKNPNPATSTSNQGGGNPHQKDGQPQQKPKDDRNVQGAWGGQKQEQQRPQQGQQKQQQHMQPGGNNPQQREGQQQQGPKGDRIQQGAWGGQKQQQHQDAGQQKQQQRMQQGGNDPQRREAQRQQGPKDDRNQQSAWGGQKHQQHQDAGQLKQQQRMQQGGNDPQRQQRPRDDSSQQGARGGQKQQQQQGTGQQHMQQQRLQQEGQGKQHQQGGGWANQRGSGNGQSESSNRQSSWGSQQNQRFGAGQQQGGSVQRPRAPDQSRGPQQSHGQQQNIRGPQQRSQDSYNQGQQQRGSNAQRQNIDNETPLPVKEKSCNGIVRGTLGAPSTVEVNYLRLNLDKMPNEAYHYDVAIDPDRPKKFLRPAFEQFRLQAFPNTILAFDGFKNCYSLERLKVPTELTVAVADGGNRTKEFKVRVQETDCCVVDLKSLRTYQNERVFDKPMRALQVLEVVLSSNNHERGVRVGRSFFRRPLDAFYLEDGYEAWTGIYQAAILGEMPLLNVDIAHKSFPCESTLLEYLDRMRVPNNEDLRNNNYIFRDITSFFNGINIIYTPPPSFGAAPKQYKVLGIGDPAKTKTFKTDDGQTLTVENYFRSRGCNLRYPNLNCLTVGSTVRQISLPMEFCSIPAGQALNRKDQSRQVEKMIRYAATSTNVRKKKIMDLLTFFDHNVNPIIRSFGLSIGSSFLKVPMRLLPSPSLEYFQSRISQTSRGAWRMDDKKFLICSKPPNGFRWAILYEESRGGRGVSYHDLEEFKALVRRVIKTSQSLNMNLQNTAEIASYRVQMLQGMLKDFAKNKFDLVFVVLSERGTAYAKIKQTAELDVGILTQCIKDKTVFRTRKDMSVFSNILLKVNGKLNGTNHKIAQDRSSNLLLPVKNVMYLGADVTHPSPDQRHIPSVVGVAASHDANGACYNCQYRLQRSTVENIEDMESIATRHLDVYYQYQKSYPEQIIYYRDGVSDGQFPIVEREEIRAIKRACAKKRCNPKLTCVIVVKRHHTRFFPLSQPQHDRDFNNVQAGTVVDQYITHPNEVQFFMVSHQSIQGTARPTRYNVIMDENKFDINLLQKLTYNLCHLFPRCNRAVSYPAPAYLAHLVAFRGRVYLEGTQRFDSNLQREYDRRQIRPEFMTRNPMYFI